MSNIMKLIVFLLFLAAISAQAEHPDPADGNFSFEGDSIVLPLNVDTGHPKVDVDVGDGAIYQFIVDTGASLNVIDEQIAEDRGYEVVGEMKIGAPGGPQIPGNIVRVPGIRLANGEITDAEFVTMDVVGFSRGTTQGVLGYGVFREHLLTFDLRAKEIRVSSGSLSAGNAGIMPYDDTNAHINIDIDVAGTRVPTHIDTGSMGGFTFPGELADQLPLKAPLSEGTPARLVGGSREIRYSELDGTIVFAGRRYKEPKISFMTPSTGFGNIGSQVYGEVQLVIDQRNKLVQFLDTPARVAAAKPRRVGVQFRGLGGGPLTVARVDPGSLAEASGLQTGDVLVSINEKPAADYAMPELGALFRGTERLYIDVDRNGDILAIEIP